MLSLTIQYVCYCLLFGMYAIAYYPICMVRLTLRREAKAYMTRTPLRTVADIGKLIRSRRRALGWDQGELAERARVSRLWINEVEQGKPGAGIARILRTLGVLHVRIVAEDSSEDSATPASRHSASDEAITRLVSRHDRKEK